MGKTPRSVIGKLVSMSIYQAPEKKVVKDEGPTKKELLASLRQTGFDDAGLEGATKEAISRVLNVVKQEEAA